MMASESSKSARGVSLLSPGPVSEAGPVHLDRTDPDGTTAKSDGKFALTSVMQSAGGRILFVLINAVTGILTARSLHPVGRGELAAMGVWPNILPNLLTLGLPSALIFEYGRRASNRVTILRCALALAVCFGLLSTVVGIVAMPFWLEHYSARIIHLAQLFMLNGTAVLLIAVVRAGCEAKGDFFASSLSYCLTPFVTLITLCGFLLASALTPATATLSYVMGGIPTLCFLLFRILPELRGKAHDLLASSRALLRYGVRSYGVDLCGTLSLYADQALVVRLLDPAAMGIYVVALSLSRTLGVIQNAVASVLFPSALKLDTDELLELTARATRLSTAVSCAGGLLIALLGPILLPLLYGQDYRRAVVLLDILIVEAILTGCTLVLTQAYMAMGRPGTVTLIQSSGILFSVPLLIIMIPAFGLLGASLALLFASLLRLVITIISFKFLLKLPFPDLMPRRSDLGIMWSRLQGFGIRLR
jgi:O-antigen/teichoic acid export membrane protein